MTKKILLGFMFLLFSWNINAQVPANDLCMDAIAVNCGDVVTGSTANATESDEPTALCGSAINNGSAPGVWYSFAGTGDLVSLSLCNNTDFDTQMLVYSGNCFGPICIEGNDQGSCGNPSEVTFISDASTNYLIYVYGWVDQVGNYELSITCSSPPPPVTNDTCDMATPIFCGDSITNTTMGATSNDVPPTCGNVFDFIDTPGVWYSLSGTGDIITLSTCITDFDTQIQVFSGNCLGLVCLGGNNDNFNICGNSGSEFSFQSDASTDYLIYVNGTGFGNDTGIFTLEVTCMPTPTPPANDECDMATVALVNTDESCTLINPATITGATESNVVNECIGVADNDVWFEFTAANDVQVVQLLNIVGNETNLVHAVYEGADCDNLTQISCSDNFGGTPNETTLQNLTIGDVYYIRIWTFASNPLTITDFDLCIRSFFPPPPPANDECDNATVANVNEDDTCAILNSGTLEGATDSQFMSDCPGSADDDVWFQFTATSEAHQISLLNIAGDVFDLVHAVYTGPDCNNLTEILCSDANTSNSSDYVVGETYYIRIYSFTEEAFQNVTFDLCINEFNTIIVNSINDPETMLSAEELIEQVFVEQGGCGMVDITVTNLLENPDGLTDISQRSWGYFKKGGTDFPLNDGIILSSGFAESAEGPNDSGGISDSGGGWAGDADLQAILDNQLGTTVPTQNATAFEFEFTSNLPLITFDFIFASEEYEDDFECDDDFRDGFAFLVKGPGIPDDSGTPFGGTNIASIEGSANVPVNTFSIHRDTFMCGGETLGVDFFPELYVSNDDENTNTQPVQFDGLTVTLTTAEIMIQPGEVYTVKLVIADRSDTAFDSAVFLAGDSFDLGDIQLGEDITIENGDAACEGESVEIDAGVFDNVEYEWSLDGNVISGETGNIINVTETGTYSVVVSFPGNTCTLEDEIFIEFFEIPEVNLGDDILICSGDNAILDGTPLNVADLDNVTYQWSLDGTEIAGETNATITVDSDGIYSVDVTSNGGCVGNDEIIVNAVNFTVDLGANQEFCGQDESFEIIPIISGEDATNATYAWSTGATTSTLTVNTTATYTVDINIGGCIESASVTITFKEQPIVVINNDDDLFKKCTNDVDILTATVTGPSTVIYSWFLDGGLIEGENTATLSVIEPGIYEVQVNNDGCIATDTIVVELFANTGCVVSQGLSPNGDNLNDNLDLEYLATGTGINKLSIFNRYGTLVYELDNYVDEWFGQDMNGGELPVGTYYYVIDVVAQDPLTGFIYINREQ